MFHVSNIIQINPNNSLIIHHNTYSSTSCIPVSYDRFSLSLFDFNSDKIINNIFEHKTNKDYKINRTYYKFNYCLMGDNFIYQICDYPHDDYYYDIFENENNVSPLNVNVYNIKKGKNILQIETPFRLISYFKDNLIFAKENNRLNVCYFWNNKFISVYKFDFYFYMNGLCILKNNDLIVWNNENNVPYSCHKYSHYKYLNK